MVNSHSPSPKICDCLAFIEKSKSVIGNLKGDFFENELKKLTLLEERFSEGRLNLAVLGQFKRGKSTLLNALLGVDVLPSAVVPLTAIPTFLKSGKNLSAKIVFNSERKPEIFEVENISQLRVFVGQFVTEENNPENEKNVLEVEIKIPDNPLLKNRVVLIDTPGIGSTYKHNTEATLNFLPQCDAALFVVSSDPPITEVELDFLKKVKEKVPRLFFVLNKIDYLDEDERGEVLDFLKKNLEKAGIDGNLKVFPVSAKQALKGKLKNDENLLISSNIQEIEEHLVGFLAKEKSEALSKAIALKVLHSLNEVLLNVDIELKSLLMPIDVLEEKLTLFERKIDELKYEKQAAFDLLKGDNNRLHQFLEEYSSELREKSEEYLEGVMDEVIASSNKEKIDEIEIRNKLAEVIPVFFEKKMGETTELFEKKVSDLLNRHKERANSLIISIKNIAAELFDVSYSKLQEDRLFELTHEPYWVTHKWNTTFNPIPPAVVDKVMPLKVRNRRIVKRIKEQIHSLVISNIENIRWSIYQSIDKSFRTFERTLEEKFDTTLKSTYGAVKLAMKKRVEQKEKVEKDIENLELIKQRLNGLIDELNLFLKSG
ncbi:conserved hypothetical protein [Thermotomaculum hydrothermale]|uniref:Dynamin N-terminal domain-containing protein n=1 Tax=Thermotomaculum hydrothermale TaxID=981385 RepID=A0A7R6SYL4_9BACT|nr:dynamin family protein [Thermotomaculum hydrothermale]BBB32686.1 conserved hypothetical protein [Thermotomaculum hydrothermale]